MGKRRISLENIDETMSLSVSDDDDDNDDDDGYDDSAIVAVNETTPLIVTSCCGAVQENQQQQPSLLLLPILHGDAASAAAETAAVADMHHHHHPSSASSDETKESFLHVFINSKGPPQIAIMCILLAFGFGSTVGVVPAVMSDRYARLNYGYTGQLDCSAYNNINHINNINMTKPEACLFGSTHAQNVVAMEQFISNSISFLTSSYIGSLSDQHGRRTILLIGLLLSTASPCCLVLIQLLPSWSPDYYYATSAMTSGLVNWFAVVLSSLSDVMPQHYRAPSFGVLLAAFSLGFATAPNFALLLDNHLHVSILAMIMIALGFLVIALYFPETLSPEAAAQATCMRRHLEQEATQQQQQQQQQQQHQQHHHDTSMSSSSSSTTSRACWLLRSRFYKKCTWKKKKNMFLTSSSYCSSSYRPIWELSILNRNRLFRLLSCLAFFNAMASSGDRTLLIYYIQEPDTGIAFNDTDIAKMFLIMGILGIFVQGFILNHANNYLGEQRLVMTCFICGVIHNLFYAMAGSGQGGGGSSSLSSQHAKKNMIFMGAAISSLVGMAFPTISAIKSNNVHKCEQGRIQGALYSLQAVASALGPATLRCVHHFTKNGSGRGSGAGGSGAFSFLVGPGSMFCFASCLYAMAAYCAHLLPPEANSKRSVSNEIAAMTELRGAAARGGVHDEEQQVPSAATPLL